ncbi:MAG TPA: ABC transporter substrate-binding protein [bacterium]|nr:ABC transporter substrate-binding protein [bacterium]
MSLFRRRPPAAKNLDQQLVFQLSKSRIPSPRQLKYIGHFVKGRERMILYICSGLMIGSLIFLSSIWYRKHIELIPDNGGRYIEGIVGNPQYINPLYASLNNVDGDLEQLIFSRLFKLNTNGQVENDLVSSFEISDNQKGYTIHLREAIWPNNQPITSDDVIFTFKLIQDPDYKSPLRARFVDVTIEKVNDRTITFNLPEAYGRFPALLNFGILPSTLWEGVSSEMIPLAELNLKPMGSGPYQLKSLVKNATGTIRSYTIERNNSYYGQAPYLDEIVFKFYPSAEEMIGALNNGQINGLAELPIDVADTIVAKNSLNYHSIPKPNLTALFFNLKAKTFISEAPIRRALTALDRTAIASTIPEKTVVPALSLLPPNQPGYQAVTVLNTDEAKQILDKSDWKLRTLTEADIAWAKTAKEKDRGNMLALGLGQWRMKGNQGIIITLTTPASLKPTAEKIIETWKQLGIKAELRSQEDTVVQSQTLVNRDFEILLYPEALEIGDPFPFWSTDGPGNISSYTRADVDSWLKEARVSSDQNLVADRYKKFQQATEADVPAIPLFWQAYVYPQPKKLKGFSQAYVNEASDRFLGATEWYFNVERKIK